VRWRGSARALLPTPAATRAAREECWVLRRSGRDKAGHTPEMDEEPWNAKGLEAQQAAYVKHLHLHMGLHAKLDNLPSAVACCGKLRVTLPAQARAPGCLPAEPTPIDMAARCALTYLKSHPWSTCEYVKPIPPHHTQKKGAWGDACRLRWLQERRTKGPRTRSRKHLQMGLAKRAVACCGALWVTLPAKARAPGCLGACHTSTLAPGARPYTP
jgi:hypothetical protein